MDITFYDIPITILIISIAGSVIALYILAKFFDNLWFKHSKNRQDRKIKSNQFSLGKVARLKNYDVLDDHRKRLNHNMIKVIFYMIIAIFFNIGLLVNPQLEAWYDIFYFIVGRVILVSCYLLAVINIIIEVLPNLSILRKAEKRNAIVDSQLDEYDKKTFGITIGEVKKLRG